ncbi:MAG: MoaD/ThiS family protein, partial [Planctomycetota bacterium]|nr:MoaD/ThiS family protein [Planctomycetota bacterium]
MSVLLHIPKFFKKYAGDQQELHIDASSMQELFATLCKDHPQLQERILTKNGDIHPYLALFLNKQSVSRDNLADLTLSPNDEVELIAMAVGGSNDNPHPQKSIRDILKEAYGSATPLPLEEVHVTQAAGRVLARAITSPVNVPAFRRSAMDGYAIQAKDSFGATLYDPIPLTLIGEVFPGKAFEGPIAPGQCVRIMTGAPVPDGADGVLKAEDSAEEFDAAFVPTKT